MFGTTPKSGQAKLRVCVQSWFSENALPGMEEVANERISQPRLPLLDEGKFKTSIVGMFCVYWDRSPDIQVVMLLPIAKSQFSLYESFMGELKIFPGTTVLPVKGMVHS